LQRFRTSILNIEIFDLNRNIDFLINKLFINSKLLSDSLPSYIWNSITSYHFDSFNKLHNKLHSPYKKKFQWLAHKNNMNKIKKIKPITYNVITNKGNYKIINTFHINPVLTNNKTLTNIKIEPSQFFQDLSVPLNNTNTRWFRNLSDIHIPEEVFKLLQFGDKFSLSVLYNKKLAIHEVIKDVESNIKKSCLENQTRIRNMIIPQFHNFLHIKLPKNNINDKLTSLLNYTIDFHQKNPEIIFTWADKGNITVALNRNTYIKKMEKLLEDTNTYRLIKKDPSNSIEKKLNDLI